MKLPNLLAQASRTLLVAVLFSCSAAQGAEVTFTGGQADVAHTVFGFNKLHKLHLSMSAQEWEAMQPAAPRGFPGFGGPAGPRDSASARKTPTDRPTYRGNMVEYPIAYGDLAEGDRIYPQVAVRYKGNFTYMASAHVLKRSLKISFARAKKPQTFHGLETINLHAGVLDPTRQREALAYGFFRAADVPASRTAFAELTLTVPGKYEREYVGLFALVEEVDEPFLKHWFKTDRGFLMKPQGVRGPEYLGERWEQYHGRYRPERAPSPEEAQRVIAFAKLVSNAPDDEFRTQIDSYLDVAEFLRFLAASAMLVNLDSPLAMPQNFYLYLDPATRRFSFLPWDMDLSLAAWPMGGAPEQQMDLSLMHPHVGEHKLIDRLLAIPAIREQYRSVLKELAGSAFTKERLLQQIDTIETTIQASLAAEAKAVAARGEARGGFGFDPAAGIAGRAPLPRVFVQKRVESIRAQLAGERSGYVPTTDFHFPGPPR